MKYLKQFVLILSISFVGELLNRLIPLPVPGSIYGIVILFLCLELGLFPVSAVRETGLFLVEIMPVMFIPAAVGLLESWDLLKADWAAYLTITVVTTFAVMAVSGRVTQYLMRHKKEGGADE